MSTKMIYPVQYLHLFATSTLAHCLFVTHWVRGYVGTHSVHTIVTVVWLFPNIIGRGCCGYSSMYGIAAN